MTRWHFSMRRRLLVVAVPCLALLVLLWLFPGQRLGMAWTLATGLGTQSLQRRIDALEDKAIRHASFSDAERDFLADFYATLATGGKISLIAPQTGGLMEHYLAASGDDYQLEAPIFTDNAKVRNQARLLLARADSVDCGKAQIYHSPTFYMPDRSQIDSVYGLYNGTLHLTQAQTRDGDCQRYWRAEVPWLWPSYAELKKKYGDPHAQSFPLPNAKSLLFGQQHALRVDNGLGQYLEDLGLAKRFSAFAEWDDGDWTP